METFSLASFGEDTIPLTDKGGMFRQLECESLWSSFFPEVGTQLDAVLKVDSDQYRIKGNSYFSAMAPVWWNCLPPNGSIAKDL